MVSTERPQPAPQTVDFGYERVPWHEKKARVRSVFDSVAPRYDLMNDVLSGGLHRLWKRFTVAQSGLRPGQSALDVAAGSGDLAVGLAGRVGAAGRVVVTDINARMLARGRDRLLDAGFAGNVAFVQADAEALPFASSRFHCVTIGFGLRNVTDKAAALGPLNTLYDLYSFQVLPRLGRLLAHDADSYRYLAESIRRHPDQETLIELMRSQGFERCRYHNLSAGIVALHVGYKL
jgi:demethylmenaquinone methyltransferase/2-methoxy-6-polyprenyl-1,4-benzoquinol methylase